MTTIEVKSTKEISGLSSYFRRRSANGTAKTSDNDYVASSGTITFAPGETTRTITVVVKGDKKKEANENFVVDLSDLSSYAVFLDSRGTGTILNDD